MGQGTWGMADDGGPVYSEADSRLDDLESGVWSGRDRIYRIEDMSASHLDRVANLCYRMSLCASCTSIASTWRYLSRTFRAESAEKCRKVAIVSRGAALKVKLPQTPTVPRGARMERVCTCGNKFTARVADVKRGWGKYCGKSCAAKNNKAGMANYRRWAS